MPSYEVDMRLNVKVPMRDGVELSADLYLPRASGTFPTSAFAASKASRSIGPDPDTPKRKKPRRPPS